MSRKFDLKEDLFFGGKRSLLNLRDHRLFIGDIRWNCRKLEFKVKDVSHLDCWLRYHCWDFHVLSLWFFTFLGNSHCIIFFSLNFDGGGRWIRFTIAAFMIVAVGRVTIGIQIVSFVMIRCVTIRKIIVRHICEANKIGAFSIQGRITYRRKHY